MVALQGQELLAWNDASAQHWESLLRAHPEALKVPCDIRETQNVGQLLRHIVAVELRYAQRLVDQPETDYATLPEAPVEAIFAVHREAVTLLAGLLGRGDAFWEETIHFSTRSSGELSATRRKVFSHALLHSIRHYAQLATLLRQHGFAPDWSMDFLFA